MSRNIRAVCKYFVENLSWRSPASGLQTPPTRNGFKQFSETSKNKVNRCGLFAAPAKPYVNNQVNRVSCQKLYTPICPSKLCASRYLWIRDSNFYSKVFSGGSADTDQIQPFIKLLLCDVEIRGGNAKHQLSVSGTYE